MKTNIELGASQQTKRENSDVWIWAREDVQNCPYNFGEITVCLSSEGQTKINGSNVIRVQKLQRTGNELKV